MINYSFIIPHHNSLELLKRCVKSIPQRDDIQIIIVDDNSDEQEKPAEEWAGVEVLYIDAQQTKGAGHARNVGLSHAEGKWLLFADADDYYKQDFMNVLDQYVDKNIDVLYFNFEHRDENLNKILTNLQFQDDFENYDGSVYSKEKIKYHHNVPWTKMVRRDFIRKYNIMFEETINGNDIFFSMLVGFHVKTLLVEKKALYTYVRNVGSITNGKKKTMSAQICKITHRFKQNSLLVFLGHKEWCKPICPLIISMLRESGLKFLFSLTRSIIPVYLNRKQWIPFFLDYNEENS